MSKKQASTKEENQTRSFHDLLRVHIDSSELKQMEMAEELGLESPNIITMFKQGKTKVPLERVPALAKVLGIDPSMLMRKAMEEYCPDLLKACEETL